MWLLHIHIGVFDFNILIISNWERQIVIFFGFYNNVATVHGMNNVKPTLCKSHLQNWWHKILPAEKHEIRFKSFCIGVLFVFRIHIFFGNERCWSSKGRFWRMTYKKLGERINCMVSVSMITCCFLSVNMTRHGWVADTSLCRLSSQYRYRTLTVRRMTGTQGNVDVIVLIYVLSLLLRTDSWWTGERGK